MSKLRIQLSGDAGHMDNYCAAVRALGGQPLAAYCPEPDPDCAGLLLCGGGDLDSALFGQPNQGSEPPDPDRDRAELALFQAYFRSGRPILGICRGMQVINVALGGTLIQDLPDALKPFHRGRDRDPVHAVQALEGSLLHQLYGPVFCVNSCHHQAAGRLGEGLRATAWSEGGCCEALDMPGRPVSGVQFHPERMAFGLRRLDTVDGAPIFTRFLALCRGEGAV